MFCSNCGNKIDNPDSDFCNVCGKDVSYVVYNEPNDYKEKYIDINEIKCPNCNAAISYGENIDCAKCNFCGSEFIIDDKATEIHRIFKARSDAQRRELQTKIEFEEYNLNLETKKELTQFITSNIFRIILSVLCLIYLIYRIITFQLVGMDFILVLIIFSMFIIPKKTNKKE